MSDRDDVSTLENPRRQHEGPVEGVIAKAPADLTEPVYAYIVGEDDKDHREGPCAWLPRGEEMPSEGDVCAIAYTDMDTPIVTMWWPGDEWPRRA